MDDPSDAVKTGRPFVRVDRGADGVEHPSQAERRGVDVSIWGVHDDLLEGRERFPQRNVDLDEAPRE